MKVRTLWVWVLSACLMFTACAAVEAEEINGSEFPSSSVLQSPWTTRPICILPVREETPQTRQETHFDTDIPDVVWDGNEYTPHSIFDLYEDPENIFCYAYKQTADDASRQMLYCIHKKSGAVKVICGDCFVFTYFKGKVYYVPVEPTVNSDGESDINRIREYDVQTGGDKSLLKLKNSIYSIAAYGEKIYYAYDTRETEESEPYSDLYAVDLDGKRSKRIIENVYTFCMVPGKIYFTHAAQTDGSPIGAFDLKSGKKKTLDTEYSDWHFEMKADLLVYNTWDSLTGYDVKTDKKYNIENSMEAYAGYGQYIIYTRTVGSPEDEEAPQNTDSKSPGIQDELIVQTCILSAYDTKTGNQYDLMDVTGMDFSLHTAQSNIYLMQENDDGSLKLYRLVIAGGKARLEPAADVAAPN